MNPKLWNYNLLYFENFIEFDETSEERPKFSRKWQTSEKSFLTLANAKSVEMKVPEYLGQWSCQSKIMSSFILKVLLSLVWCRWTPRIIDNMTNFRKIVLDSSQCKKCLDIGFCVYWTLVTCLANYKTFILELLLRLAWCPLNASNYRQNDEFPENCTRV